MFPLLLFASSLLVAAASGSSTGPSRYGGTKAGRIGRGGRRKDRRQGRRKDRGSDQGRGGGDDGGPSDGQDVDPYERAMNRIDLEFDVDGIGDEVASDMFEEFGVFPGPPSGAQTLQSAALAQPGSWTQRNVLQAGARDAWSRRISGSATEADYAVLRAARPGIASSESGYIGPAWSKSPWPGTGGMSTAGDDDALENAVLKEMGL